MGGLFIHLLRRPAAMIFHRKNGLTGKAIMVNVIMYYHYVLFFTGESRLRLDSQTTGKTGRIS